MKYLLFIFFLSCTKVQPEVVQAEQTFIGKDLEFFNAVNEMRLSRNLPTVKGNKQLTDGCKQHTLDMIAVDSLNHIGVGTRGENSRAETFSEVVAYGYVNAESFLSGYMNSAKHRTALIDAEKTDIGISTIGLYQTVNLASYERN